MVLGANKFRINKYNSEYIIKLVGVYIRQNKRYKWKLSLQMETNDKLRSIKYKSELFLLTYIN